MKRDWARLYALPLALCLLLVGCAGPTTEDMKWTVANLLPTPEQPLYVLAAYIENEWIEDLTFHTHELVIVDRESWRLTHRREIRSMIPEWIHPSLPAWIDQDTTGRMWMGYSPMPASIPDNRVKVLDAEGLEIRNLRLCYSPDVGVHFIGNRAFIPCRTEIAVVDVERQELVELVEIKEAIHHILAIGGDDNRILLFGAGHEGSLVYVLDPDTLETEMTLPVGYFSTSEIYRYGERFYLPNRASSVHPQGLRNDLIMLDFSIDPPQVAEITLPHRSPAGGTLVGSHLYQIHDPIFGNAGNAPERHMSRLDLDTGEAIAWPLPEDIGRVMSIAVVNGEIVLGIGRNRHFPERVSGLYRLDQQTGKMELLVEHPAARFYIVQPERIQEE